MEIKGKTILSIRGSKGKEFLTISISSKGKDGKKERVIGAYISEYKVLEKYQATEEVTDDKLPF